MIYGSKEFAYAEPFANALVDDPDFRAWVLEKTKFAAYSRESHVLKSEMEAARSSLATNWWRSHFTEKCRCAGCSGQETDILVLFEAASGLRFALHIEVKQPTDRFAAHKDQAGNYAIRAQCWTTNPPKAVPPHADAATMLLCSASKLEEFAPHASKFGSFITFEEVAERFPAAVGDSAQQH